MMHLYQSGLLEQNYARMRADLLAAPEVQAVSWQSQDISDKPELQTKEVLNACLVYDIPNSPDQLAHETETNLPWAEDHFQERIGGEPLNPPPSEQWWPYAQQGNKSHKAGEVFSHTYPERIWPRYANVGNTCPNGRQTFVPHMGIRYPLGDLQDVLNLMTKDPLTRQAYLPIWFPEDTGAISGQRVPCTLGYLFMLRDHKLHITYHIRSCDYVRHMRDDIYMACRLAQWMKSQLSSALGIQLGVGELVMNMTSLHIFKGDISMLTLDHKRYMENYNSRLMGAL